jgi:hypothetical protein
MNVTFYARGPNTGWRPCNMATWFYLWLAIEQELPCATGYRTCLICSPGPSDPLTAPAT